MRDIDYSRDERERLGRQVRRPIDLGSELTKARADAVDVNRPGAKIDTPLLRNPAKIEAAVSNYLNDVQAGLIKIPANPVSPDLPHFSQIAKKIRVSPGILADKDRPFRAQIESLSKKSGLDDTITYANRDINIMELAYVLVFSAKFDAQHGYLNETKLEKTLKEIERAFGALVPAYAPDRSYSARLAIEAALADAGLNAEIAVKLTEARSILDGFGPDNLPPMFTPAMQIVCSRFNIGSNLLAKAIGASLAALWKWRIGTLFPTKKSRAMINALECLAGLPSDCLWNRCGNSSRNDSTRASARDLSRKRVTHSPRIGPWRAIRLRVSGRPSIRPPGPRRSPKSATRSCVFVVTF